MRRYDYYTAVYNDVKDYYNDNKDAYEGLDRDDLIGKLLDDCFVEDRVTGNASGSYTFNRHEAEENLCYNTDLLAEACEEFDSDAASLLFNPESADVTIRFYLLNQVVYDFVESLDLDDVEEED